MPRSRPQDPPPDRLAAVLEQLDAVRSTPGWVPDEDDVLDRPRSRVADLPRRVAATRRSEREERQRVQGRHTAGDVPGEVRPRQRLLRPPEPLLGAQVAPSRLAVIGAIVLVVAAALVFGGRVVWARNTARPQPVTAPTSTSSSASGSARAFAAGTSTSPFASAPVAAASSTTGTLIIQVVGQVHRPGVVHVPGGSRVQDAVAAAGGALPNADLAAINLARPLTDGEQIQVLKPGEHPSAAAQPVPTGAVAPSVAGATGSSGATGMVVDLNSADATALDTLPGVGPVMAQRILQWRAENGRFTSVEELGEVSGIGDKVLARLRPLVRVG